MPYCKEFNDLFSEPEFENILQQNPIFGELGLTKADVEQQINKRDCDKILPWLDRLYDVFEKNKEKIQPFHLGLGNPDAKILFVGHELALDKKTSDPALLRELGCRITTNYYKKLFVNEAILNYFLWACKINRVNIDPNCCIQNPEFPSSFCKLYNTEPKKVCGRHYWRNINTVINHCFKINLAYNAKQNIDSFFRYVFLTELNNIPANQTLFTPNKNTILNKLHNLATLEFYKKFDRIVLACNRYVNRHLELIQQNYNAKTVKSYPKGPIKRVFEVANKRIIICNNISGSTFSNEDLKKLGELLNNK